MRTTSIMVAAAVSALLFAFAVACGSDGEAEAETAPAPQATTAAAAAAAPTPVSPTAAAGSTSAAPTSAPAPEPTPSPVPVKTRRTGDEPVAPELRDTGAWINSEPFTLESRHGEVVLVDFWTFSCVNCIRTLPYLKSWHEKYADSGLVILGVHAPEFEFEKVLGNVQEAVEEFGLLYPIVQDNDFGTWRAFRNRYWPAKYLIDQDGYIRYAHFGEGRYDETEQWIRDLLEETGADLSGISDKTEDPPALDVGTHDAGADERVTRELYAGFRRNFSALQSGATPPYVLHQEFFAQPGEEVLYTDPGEHQNHFMYLEGLWRNTEESLVHARNTEGFSDYVALLFYGTSVNGVMAPVDSEPFTVRLIMDEAPLTAEQAGADVIFDEEGNSVVVVDKARMYHLVELDSYGGHELKLSSETDDMELFAFTFGAYDTGR